MRVEVNGVRVYPACPIADQEDIAAAIPATHARFERIANAGHLADRDDPLVFDVIREFIRS
jgi:pimeloyl-ACP methyl ester carboxylesterase